MAEAFVYHELCRMQRMVELFHRPSLKKNRESAKKIQNTIRRLKHQIATAPPFIESHMHICNYPNVGQPLPTILEMLGAMDRKLADHVTLSAASDHIKILCAEIAVNIILHCSQKKPASSSANSPLRIITGLIYEQCTGKRQRDLERACEAALRRKREPVPDLEVLFDRDPRARLLWYDLEEQFVVWRRKQAAAGG
jgi:hypothetical protein